MFQPGSVCLCSRSSSSSVTGGGSERLHSPEQSLASEGLGGGGLESSGRPIIPLLLFSFLILSLFTSFQAESLLVRRKVWRGNECRRKQRRKRGRRRRQRGRQADKPQQEATHTRTHTHTRTPCACVCVCPRGRDCATERANGKGRKEGRESDAEAGRAAPPLPLPLSLLPLLPLSVWSRRVAASDSV